MNNYTLHSCKFVGPVPGYKLPRSFGLLLLLLVLLRMLCDCPQTQEQEVN
jgi:hypothetical protein